MKAFKRSWWNQSIVTHRAYLFLTSFVNPTLLPNWTSVTQIFSLFALMLCLVELCVLPSRLVALILPVSPILSNWHDSSHLITSAPSSLYLSRDVRFILSYIIIYLFISFIAQWEKALYFIHNCLTSVVSAVPYTYQIFNNCVLFMNYNPICFKSKIVYYFYDNNDVVMVLLLKRFVKKQ